MREKIEVLLESWCKEHQEHIDYIQTQWSVLIFRSKENA